MIDDRQFAHLVKGSVSIRQLLIKMNRIPAGGNYATIKRRIKALQLDTSRFVGQPHSRGKRLPGGPRRPLTEILVRDSTYCGGSYKLKNHLLKAGLLQYRCADCGRTRWRGQPIPLELEHRNGVRDDYRV